jgi:uncharacterized protein (DUF1697 family)
MPTYVALLRAINVGGTGKLSMGALRQLCLDQGFENVTTYIQSGNAIFSSALAAAKCRELLAVALTKKVGKLVGVFLRTVKELEAIVQRNPFGQAAPNRVVVFFLDKTLPKQGFDRIHVPGCEVIEPSGREVFVHYPEGQGQSKLRLPFADLATARNLNTVSKLLELSRALAT